MLVRFVSSETGEVLMFADVARVLLQTTGKETTARGTFIPGEMLAAATALRAAAQASGQSPDDVEEDENGRKKPVITLGQRAWPLIDMLERTAGAGSDAYIVWEAAADF